MLLFKGANWHTRLSPEQIQQTMLRWQAWYEALEQRGSIKNADPLERAGRIVAAEKTRAIVDGPFVESKESVGGYFIVEVPDLDAAVALAKACPALEHGLTIEVRPVADRCPIFRQLDQPAARTIAVA